MKQVERSKKKLMTATEIAFKVGKVLGKYKGKRKMRMGSELVGGGEDERKEVDGIYVIEGEGRVMGG